MYDVVYACVCMCLCVCIVGVCDVVCVGGVGGVVWCVFCLCVCVCVCVV